MRRKPLYLQGVESDGLGEDVLGNQIVSAWFMKNKIRQASGREQ